MTAVPNAASVAVSARNAATSHALWPDRQACRVADLEAILDAGHAQPRPASAAEIVLGIPVYDCEALRLRLAEPALRSHLMAEWHHVLADGAGVLMLAGAFALEDVVDRVTAEFFAMIEDEKATGSGGDHFAKAGANNRVWNALQKLALRNPAAFCDYYGNPFLALPALAWLGPGYQVTSQVNCVNPGGEAQQPHRDYHLGFCTPQQACAYPMPVHRELSPRLTLQGAVAHVDMPVESGPTLLLPHSQKYPFGYLVAGREDFDRCFDARRVQPPLRKGDAVFFNPALLHAAGSNKSASIRRIANLLQISSAFGRAMEAVDRAAMCLAIYPALLEGVNGGEFDPEHVQHAIASCAEGYAFPTNLDRDPPLGGLAPQSQQALMARALNDRLPLERFASTLADRAASKRA
jgi:ectoine hydroxylase-related dioxygenase (phytanoyl-CoA dioxygenase family)